MRSHHPFAGILEKFDAKPFVIAPDDLTLSLVIFLFDVWQCHSDDLTERRYVRRLNADASAAVVDQVPFVESFRRGKEYIPGKGMPGIFTPVMLGIVMCLRHSQLLSLSIAIADGKFLTGIPSEAALPEKTLVVLIPGAGPLRHLCTGFSENLSLGCSKDRAKQIRFFLSIISTR